MSSTAVFMVPLRFASRADGNPHERKRIMPLRGEKERDRDNILPLEVADYTSRLYDFEESARKFSKLLMSEISFFSLL